MYTNVITNKWYELGLQLGIKDYDSDEISLLWIVDIVNRDMSYKMNCNMQHIEN